MPMVIKPALLSLVSIVNTVKINVFKSNISVLKEVLIIIYDVHLFTKTHSPIFSTSYDISENTHLL